MNGSHRGHDPSLAVFLTEAGKIPLLDHAAEIVLGRELRERHRELERLLLGSHYVWRKVLAWQERVAAGELAPAELMPRGRKSPAQAGAMRRRLRGTCRILKRALKGGAAAHDRALAALEALNLNRKKLLALADELRADLRGRPSAAERGELLELAARVAQAKERIAAARTALVEANIRLAVSVAKRYSHPMMDFADLVQEGTLGLMKAADRYDERLGYKFSTYATWWVRQSIQRAIEDKSATIRLPAHVHTLRDRLRALQLRFRAEHGRDPDDAELARGLDVSPEMLRAVLAAAHEPLSISSEPDGGADLSLEDSIPETASPSPLATVKERLRAGELEAALERLSSREAEVLRMRYGLGCDPMTLDAAGRKLGLTRERIRQIESKAIKRLRAPQFAARLKDYWENGQ